MSIQTSNQKNGLNKYTYFIIICLHYLLYKKKFNYFLIEKMAQITIPNNNVVTSKAETPEAPVVVSQQSLLSALSYLRAELEKLKKENKELSTERTTLFEQLENEKNKNNNNIINNNNNEIVEDSNSINQKDNNNNEDSTDSTLSKNDDHKKLIEELTTKIEQIEKEKKEEITNIESQLEQSKEEKKQLEVQHQSLIAKLANFKTSIADKLKADNVLIDLFIYLFILYIIINFLLINSFYLFIFYSGRT